MWIYVVLAIVMCNMTSFRASKMLVSLFAIELGASQLAIGVMVAVYSVFPMLFAFSAGRLADRFGVRLPMIAGSGGIALGLLVPYLRPSLAGLYASAALIGAAHVFYNVSVQSLIGSLSGADDRTRNFANYGLVMASGSFVGPLIAGFSIDRAGHALSYLYFSVLPLVPVAIMLAARQLGRRAAATGEGDAHPSNIKALLGNKRLRRTLFTSAAILTGIDLFQFYMPIYGHSIGLSATTIGFILSMFAAAAFVVRLVMPAMVRRWSADAVLTWSLFAGGLVYLLFPFFQSPLLLAAMAFALGLGMGCGQPLTLSLIYARAPQGRTGAALGLRISINNFMHIAVPVVFGSLGSLLGVAPVFVANAVILAGGGELSRRADKA